MWARFHHILSSVARTLQLELLWSPEDADIVNTGLTLKDL